MGALLVIDGVEYASVSEYNRHVKAEREKSANLPAYIQEYRRRTAVAARILTGLTQAELAKASDLPVETIWQFEASEIVPNETYTAIKRALSKAGALITESDELLAIVVTKRRN